MASGDDTETLTQNRVFDLLSNARRRFVLHYLSRQDGPVELRQLADEVARWETGSESLSRQERKRVYVSLYQSHIPRLVDAGIVEFDSESGLVRLVDNVAEINRYIDGGERERSWPVYYLAAAVLGGGLYLLAALDLITVVDDVVIGLVTVVALIVISIAHVVVVRRRRRVIDFDVEEREPPGDS